MPPTNPTSCLVRSARLVLLLVLALIVVSASARDLASVGDGEHLWLVIEDPKPQDKDQPQLIVYHLADDAERGQMLKLKPIEGKLMRSGLTAGQGQLLIVLDSRRIEIVRPVMSKLTERWEYERRTLPMLPDNCALVSIVMGHRGPWALVRVESQQALTQLDKAATDLLNAGEDPAELNRALGLPEDFEFSPQQPVEDQTPTDKAPADQADDAEASADVHTQADPEAQAEPDNPDKNEAEAEADTESVVETQAEQSEANNVSPPASADAVPAYRLITLHGGRWISSPLPPDFAAPRHAVLLMDTESGPPTILAEVDADGSTPGELLWYSPGVEVEPAKDTSDATDQPTNTDTSADTGADNSNARPAPGWLVDRVSVQSIPLGQWSATWVGRQVALTIEHARSDQSVSADVFWLHLSGADLVRRLTLPTDGPAHWSAVPWREGVALVARPGPKLQQASDGQTEIKPIAGMIGLNLESGSIIDDSEADQGVVVLYEARPTPIEDNANLLIQIGAFVTAMVIMLLFYRRAPRPHQLDLPDQVVLAGYGRRLFAGVIDLLPGFWLAGQYFDISVTDTLLYWPGSGVAKALPAMRPGLMVIGVTVLHTTVCEFIFARSIGKWATGLYVADLAGRPAPPVPSLVRALSRLFDLFAPLMLVLVFISPGRQRLGDILARTLVVMRAPKPFDEERMDDEF